MEELNTTQDILEIVKPEAVVMPTGDKSYELNEDFEIEFNARPGAPKPVMVTHKLRRPSYDELYGRETKLAYRTRDVGKDEEEVLPSGDDANVYLYDRIIKQVSGGYNQEKFIDFTKYGDDRNERASQLAKIPSMHKNQVIGAMYSFDSEVYYAEDADLDNFIWGDGETYTIRTEMGLDPMMPDFIVDHELREPTEGEMINFNRDRAVIRIERGTKKPVSKVMSNLSAGVKLYDALIKNVKGATYNGSPVDVTQATHLKAIDPIMKQQVVNALIKSVGVDLGK